MMRALMTLLALMLPVSAVAEEGRHVVGLGRLFSNDYLGDGQDRWRTSAYTFSVLTQDGDGTAPFDLLEYRFRSESIAPRVLDQVAPGDRAYVGQFSAGVHTQYTVKDVEVSGGVDLVITGPKTGHDDFQNWFHDLINQPRPSQTVRDTQIGDAVYPTITAEVARSISLNDSVTVRPFFEAMYGVEDLVRVGGDIYIGQAGMDLRKSRDPGTGHRYNFGESVHQGVSFVLGGDIAYVNESAYFPADFGTEMENTRYRLRAGANWQVNDRMSLFYGATYLSEEYVGQPEGQVLGSVKLIFNF